MNSNYQQLSKREQQIMSILHRRKEASVAEVLEDIPNPPGYNSIRRQMTILENRGIIQHRKEKNKYYYRPVLQQEVAKKSALDRLMDTYFERSVPKVVSTLLSDNELSDTELDELSAMIAAAKKQKEA